MIVSISTENHTRIILNGNQILRYPQNRTYLANNIERFIISECY